MSKIFKQSKYLGFRGGSDSKESACNVGDLGLILRLGRRTATHSSILAWRISWIEESGWLQSPGW